MMFPMTLSNRLANSFLTRRALDPFVELQRFAEQACGPEQGLCVRCDVCENDEHVIIDLEVPGFGTQDVAISCDQNVLTISGERKQEERCGNEHRQHTERRSGRFSRSFRLPDGLEQDSIDATLKDGVLTVTIAKTEKVQPRKIEVKNG